MNKAETIAEGVAMQPRVRNAMMLALREMRTDLRSRLEIASDASFDVPPRPGALDFHECKSTLSLIAVIRACAECTGRMPNDDQPRWLDDVIAGRLAL